MEKWENIPISDNTPFGCKIKAAAAAYADGGEKFLRFWVQDGGTTIVKIDDAALMETSAECDYEEAAAFLRTLDVSTLSCTLEAAENLKLPIGERGEIMALHIPHTQRFLNTYADVEENPGPREIYTLLEQAATETFEPPEFEPFYMDLSYRTRHGAALSVGIRQGERLAACALCTAMTERTAVISGVACHPELRRHGYAGTAVNALIGKLNRETLYIFRAEGENEAFYRSLGFQSYGFWSNVSLEERG